MKIFFFLLLTIPFLFTSCTDNDADNNENTKSNVAALSFAITASYPHDTSSFTQGLVFYNGQLLEGTGNRGKSKLAKVDLKTGKAISEMKLDSIYFGEGITVLNDTLFQLTWTEKVVFVYSAKDFKKIRQFSINTEGWGITHDGKNLIVSDGSNNLYFYEPSTFRLLRTQGVTEDGSPAMNLNELEYINGAIYANQWQYNYILKIDPASGHVVARLDLTDLHNRVKAKTPGADFLNGIAYDAISKKVFVTGKYWPEIFEIDFPY
jgi:glutamine cyclotransferase